MDYIWIIYGLYMDHIWIIKKRDINQIWSKAIGIQKEKPYQFPLVRIDRALFYRLNLLYSIAEVLSHASLRSKA